MKKFIFYSLFLCNFLLAQDIQGFWKTVNEEGVAQTIIAIYEYDGLYYGRIIAIYNQNGTLEESIFHPIQRAPGVIGDPYYCGLDIIWYLQQLGSKFKGKILDPQKGDVYAAEVWLDKGDLVVRGKLLFFGRSQKWFSVSSKDLPINFKLPNLNSLVPDIPTPK